MDYGQMIENAKSLAELREIEAKIRNDKRLDPEDAGLYIMWILDREEDFGSLRLD